MRDHGPIETCWQWCAQRLRVLQLTSRVFCLGCCFVVSCAVGESGLPVGASPALGGNGGSTSASGAGGEPSIAGANAPQLGGSAGAFSSAGSGSGGSGSPSTSGGQSNTAGAAQAGGSAGSQGGTATSGGPAGGAPAGGAAASGGAAGTSSVSCADHALPAKTAWKATASSYFVGNTSELPALAIDADLNTRWASGVPQAGGEWLQVDFGEVATIDKVTLQLGGSVTDFPNSYEVRLSSTDKSFNSKTVAMGAGAHGGDTVVTFPNKISGRYLLISQTGSGGAWWSVAELLVSCSN